MYGLVLLSLLISIAASIYVRVTYNKYKQIRNERGITGAEAARRMLDDNGLFYVGVEPVSGELTDHYDPTMNVIRLSDGVYNSDSVAAVGVAMHEAGHALQYAQNYAPVKIRHAIVKSTNIASWISYILVVLGIAFGNSSASYTLITLGIIFFLAVVFFQLVTLPVEFNASRRAVETLRNGGFLNPAEQKGASAMLRSAAMTYVAALVVSLLQLLRLLAIRNRRR